MCNSFTHQLLEEVCVDTLWYVNQMTQSTMKTNLGSKQLLEDNGSLIEKYFVSFCWTYSLDPGEKTHSGNTFLCFSDTSPW